MMRFLLCLTFGLWSLTASASALLWKRAPLLEQDLARALELPRTELCRELGQFSCLAQVHQYALGGHDPFERGQFRPMEEPSLLTAIAFERVVQLGCLRRLEEDTREAPATVFRHFALDIPLEQIRDEAVRAQIVDLYQRFLLRDPTPIERDLAMTLADRRRFEQRSGRDVALALCMAIGSQLEFLLF